MGSFKLHEVKTLTEHYTEVLAGKKSHEVRFNDRDYQVGDLLNMREIEPDGEYTGQEMNAQITHVLLGGQFGIEEGWCVLSLTSIAPTKAINLIGLLRDRLQETSDCIEASHNIIREAGYTTEDAQRTVEDARAFIDLADEFLETVRGDD